MEEETKKENVETTVKPKINFFKKIYYSIFKINKYDEMTYEGLKKAIKYFFGMIAILTIVVAIISTCSIQKELGKAINLLNENLPEFKLSNGELTLNDEGAVIIDDEQVIKSLGYVTIINTSLEEQDVINEYSSLTNDNNCMIFTKNESIALKKGFIQNSEDGTSKQDESKKQIYTYNDLLKTYNLDTSKEYTKQDLINYVQSKPATYYFIQYFIIYFIIHSLTFALDVVLLGLLGMLSMRLFKITNKSKYESFSMAIYALTLPMILYLGYLLFNFITGISFSWIETVIILVGYVYVITILYKRR